MPSSASSAVSSFVALSRPSVVKVRTTVASPREVTYALGPRTLVSGGEGAGKTRLLHALELALTKRTGDLLGRGLEEEPVAGDDLIAALGVPGTDLYAIVTFDDGKEAVWAREWKRNGWAKAEWIVPPYVDPARALPVRNAKAALRQDSARAAEFFLGTGVISRERALGVLSPGMRAKAAELFDDTPEPPPALLLSRIVQLADRRKLDLQAAAREAERVAVAAAPPLVLEGDVDAMAREAGESAEHRVWRLAVARDAACAAAAAAVEEEAEAKTAAMEANVAYESMRATPAPKPPADVEVGHALLDVATALERILPHVTAAGEPDLCPLCGGESPEGSLTTRLGVLRLDGRERIARGREYAFALQRYEEAIKRAQAVAEETSDAMKAASDKADRALRECEEACGRLDPPDRATPETEPAPSTTPEALAELRAQAREYARWAQAGERAKEHRRQADEYKELAEAAEAAQRALARERVGELTAKVAPFLDEGEVLDVLFEWAGKDVFLPALRTNGVVMPALSGAQTSRVLFALAGALLPAPPTFALLLTDDRDRAPDRIRAWASRLSGLDAQIVVTSATPPKALPAGWTTITL